MAITEEQRLFEQVVYADHLLQKNIAVHDHSVVFETQENGKYENKMMFVLWCGWCLAKGHPMPEPHNGYPKDIAYVRANDVLSSSEMSRMNFVFTDLNFETQTALILKNRYGFDGRVTFETLLSRLANAKEKSIYG